MVTACIYTCDLIGSPNSYFSLAVFACMAHVSTALYLAVVFGAGHGHCMYVLYSTNDGLLMMDMCRPTILQLFIDLQEIYGCIL